MSIKKDISTCSNLRIKKNKGLSLLNVLEDIDRERKRQKELLNRISINGSRKKSSSLFSSESDSTLIRASEKFGKETLNSVIRCKQLPTKNYKDECLSNSLNQDNLFAKCKTSCSVKNVKEKKIDQNKTLTDNFSLDSNDQNSIFIQETNLASNTSKICEELEMSQILKEINKSEENNDNVTSGKENKETYINLKYGKLIETKEVYSQFDGVISVACIRKNSNVVKKRELQNKGIQAHRKSHHYLSPYHSPPNRFLFRSFTDPICRRQPFSREPSSNTSNFSAIKQFQISSAESPSFPSNSVQILFPQNNHKKPRNKHKKKISKFNSEQCKSFTHANQNNNVFQKLCRIATKNHGMLYLPRNTQKATNNTYNNKNEATEIKGNEGKRSIVSNEFKYAPTSRKVSNTYKANKQFTNTILKSNQDNTVYYQQFVPNCNNTKKNRNQLNFERQNLNEDLFDPRENGNIQCKTMPSTDSYQFNDQKPNYYDYSMVQDDCSLFKKSFIKPTNKHTISNNLYHNYSHLPQLLQNNCIRNKKLGKNSNFEVYNTGPYGANVFNNKNEAIEHSQFSKKNTLDELIKLNESAKVTSGKKLSDFPEVHEHVKKS